MAIFFGHRINTWLTSRLPHLGTQRRSFNVCVRTPGGRRNKGVRHDDQRQMLHGARRGADGGRPDRHRTRGLVPEPDHHHGADGVLGESGLRRSVRRVRYRHDRRFHRDRRRGRDLGRRDLRRLQRLHRRQLRQRHVLRRQYLHVAHRRRQQSDR